ncbi:LPS export ABC transporter permease LptF [Ottowia thiooxydans]|uniref:LPS export ABC transporter permease LptF n=1 Tax=Ottowia thiooxydans TaxID=219182 RepID=UPI000414A1FC|nr:LPS export ABC transporter permease LptF [Ottowia thiooxydans]
MLFHSSFRKELSRSFGATLVVLVTIVMTMILIRTLGQASLGSVNPSEVFLVMGFTVVGQLPTILTLSLFISVTSTLTRMYASSEMVVWFSSGQNLTAFLRPLLRFAAPILLVVGLLALVVWPWSNVQIRELRDRYQSRGDIERVAPGQFQESAGGQRVFFIDKFTAGSDTGRNIFISDVENQRESVTSAQSGSIQMIKDERFLMLNNGQRLQTELDTGATRVSEFVEYGVHVSDRTLGSSVSDSPRFKATPALVMEPTARNLSELSWRLGLLFAAANCVVIALAATRVNPRVGRSAGLIFALFVFATYYNLVNVGQSWIANGRVNFLVFMLALHGGIFLLALSWMMVRQGNWPSLRRRRGCAP